EPYTSTFTGHLPAGVTLTAVADDLVVAGVPTEGGTFTPTLTVHEPLGHTASRQISLVVTEPVLALSRILHTFLLTISQPLTVEEQSYLDAFGNKNGRY